MGTRQNALFTLTSVLTDSPNPVVVLDEPEIGLEPYSSAHSSATAFDHWQLSQNLIATIRVTSCTPWNRLRSGAWIAGGHRHRSERPL